MSSELGQKLGLKVGFKELRFETKILNHGLYVKLNVVFSPEKCLILINSPLFLDQEMMQRNYNKLVLKQNH